MSTRLPRLRRPLVCLAVVGGTLAMSGLAGPAAAFAAAAAASPSSDWELDFRPGELRHFIDPVDGNAYWYFTYSVVNRTGSERMWAPKFEFYGDRGQLLDAGKGVPTRVTKALLDRAGTEFTQDQYQILGPLLVGEENAKDGLVVFPSRDPEITEITVFVGGVSSKIRREPDPVTGEPRTQRRVLRLEFHVPGEAARQPAKPANPASSDERVNQGAEKRAAPAGAAPGTDAGCWEWR
jgi:hypothetical protein